MLNKQDISKEFQTIQDEICAGLEQLDGGSKFVQDLWERDGGGGGRTRTFTSGAVIEKGGVNFSEVHGALPEALQKEFKNTDGTFFATGVSIVLHPNTPKVPIIHMNIRYFELDNGEYWFGGGIDLTPHYVVPQLAKEFHLGLKEVCDQFNDSFYTRFKSWADDYFFIPHRNETRGVGGIFFDKLKAEDEKMTKDQLFAFVQAVGRSFVDLYANQVKQTRELGFTEQEQKWQQIRRGRYVEFNLVNDRGTRFGLLTNGRTESILMSLPANASWEYNLKVDENSEEQNTLNHLKKGIDWGV